MFSLGFMLAIVVAVAQTANNKIEFNAGFGFLQYNGDLGNDFYKKSGCSYGAGSVGISYYLTKSFDIGISGFMGDYSYCQPEEMKNKEVPDGDKCVGCVGRVGMGNLSSRIVAGGVFLKYKFANGYLLSENAKWRPYIYSGIAINILTDRMKKNCVDVGNYCTINGGLGLQYYLNERMNICYNIGFGYFTTDKVDFISRGGNDMYMQNTLSFGIDFF